MNKYIPTTNRLMKIQERLFSAVKVTPFTVDASWLSIPKKPGIYAIWTKGRNSNPVYFGASSNLSERLKDFGNPATHTFAKQIKLKISATSTPEVRAHIQKKYMVSYISLAFGRAEAEEFLITKYATYVARKFNDAIPRRWRCDT